MTTWHRLRVEAVVQETKVDKSFVLAVPSSLRASFRWRAGQHVVIERKVDGEPLRRCYSISSPPGSALRLTVRKIRGGRVSGDLHEHVTAGSTLDVSAPCGAFLLDTGRLDGQPTNAYRTHYYFAAGSGITPIFSMIAAVLASEPYSTVHLLYGNRHLDQILFRAALDGLKDEHGDRFSLVHSLTSPPWWSSFDGWRGRVDAGAVRRFIDRHPPVAQDAHYRVCGPGSMNATVKQVLLSIDVPPERIHAESFGSPFQAGGEKVRGVAATLGVSLGERRTEVPVEAGETLLDAMLRQGLPAPHTCTAGVCGSCLARLIRGRVHQKSSFALDAADVESGLVLTCQAVPRSPRIELRYDS